MSNVEFLGTTVCDVLVSESGRIVLDMAELNFMSRVA
jgi:hypothetical protein